MKLTLSHLSKTFGDVCALQDVSIEMEAGIYGILGPNGAGKSTLMNVLTGNLKQDSGEIFYDGENKDSMKKKYRELLGYMPQQQICYPDMTLYEFLNYMSLLKEVDAGRAKVQMAELLDLLNLSDVANRTLRTFSGGMKRRAILAQALLGDPKILILDEPTAGLDPKERITLRNLIAELSGDRIVILATHIVSDIECIANRVVLLRQGRLLANDSPGHLIGTISGKVGKKQISRTQIAAMQKQKNIGNIVQSKDGFMVHVISDTLPNDVEKITSEITLEDVFLYYFEADRTHEP
ncbi:MAG: ATP-binding cassette domain-containing protein [Lachnospiraceae bacterium]|nr:ATP-binding cassette domain-containing protein [Lachnospiraceae bacterium]